jgi:beta-1,4-mannosyl-glycoprotein beta-1,4-N-acetylglucosaminyltransferase
MPKIYDCFPFFNELDLLEIRLNYLNSVVDYFVICESITTHSGLPKKLFYLENKHLFEKFEDKIIHVVVEDTPKEWLQVKPFLTDQYQRNAIIRGVKQACDDDIIITSDVDEIPNIDVIKNLNNFFKTGTLYHLAQEMFYYYLNLKEVSGKLLSHTGEFAGIEEKKWLGTKICDYGFLKNYNIDKLRHPEMKDGAERIPNGGWHFTYVGSHRKSTASERVQLKIASLCHQEFNNNFYKLNVKNKIDSNEDVFFRDSKFEVVPIDNSFPSYIVENREKFSHLIKD